MATKKQQTKGNGSAPDTGLVWGEPPTRRRGRPSVWPTRLAPLTERPGQWARVYFHAGSSRPLGSTIAAIRKHHTALAAQYEFAVRTLPDGAAIFARYLGGKRKAAA